MPDRPLEEILSLFLERDEVAPGIIKVSLPLGEHRLGVQIRSLDGALSLRAFVLDAMPPDLARNAVVREKITSFPDLVKTGRILRDDAGRPYIESELGSDLSGREQYMQAFEALAVDCARLRGAAEGLVAVAQGAIAAAPPRTDPVILPAVAPAAAAPKRRLWDTMIEKSMPGASMADLTRRKHKTTEIPAAPAATAAAEKKADEAPVEKKADEKKPGEMKPGEKKPEEKKPDEKKKILLEEKRPDAMKPEPKPATGTDFARVHRIARVTALEIAALAPMDEEQPPPATVAGKEAVVPFSLDSFAPPESETGALSEVAFGADPDLADKPKRSAAGQRTLSDADFAMPTSPETAGESGRPLAERASRDADEFASWLEDLGDEGGDKGLAPEGSTATGGPPLEIAPRRPSPRPPDPAGGRPPDASGSGREKKAHEAVRPTLDRFRRSKPGEAGKEAPPHGDAAKKRQSRSFFDDVDAGPKSQAARATLPQGEDLGEDSPEESAAIAPPAAKPGAAKPTLASDKLPKLPLDMGNAGLTSGRNKAPEGAGGRSGRFQGGDDVLSWMDELEKEADAAAVPELPAHERTTARRRFQLSIPKALLPSLRKVMLDWYRRPDRDVPAGRLKKGNEELHVETATEPGVSSWRYPKPILRLSRAPIDAGAHTFFHEPQELTLDEVEAWLTSESLIDEEEVKARRQAAELRQRAWELRAEGDVEGALKKLDEVLALFPNDIQAVTSIGHIHRRELKQPEKANQFYERALTDSPKYAPALLGRVALLVEKDRHRAAEEAVQALALAPRDPDALELAGLITLKAGRKARARELFLRLFRVDRDRGAEVLKLVEAERGGEVKWDPRLVASERQALEAQASGKPAGPNAPDAVTLALYKERAAVADQFDALFRDWDKLKSEDRKRTIEKLAVTPSYTFLADLLEKYAEERDEPARVAIEAAFLRSPMQGNMVLEDALAGADFDRASAAVRIAAQLKWTDLVKPALAAFTRARVGRHVTAFATELVRISGAEVAYALLAKLERGSTECRDAILKILGTRPNEPADEAAVALRAVMDVEGALTIEDADRTALEAALKPVEVKGKKKRPAAET